MYLQVKLKEEHYPYERADKFNRGIRKLGLTPEGLTYLDKFRALITHIGEVLAIVVAYYYAIIIYYVLDLNSL